MWQYPHRRNVLNPSSKMRPKLGLWRLRAFRRFRRRMLHACLRAVDDDLARVRFLHARRTDAIYVPTMRRIYRRQFLPHRHRTMRRRVRRGNGIMPQLNRRDEIRAPLFPSPGRRERASTQRIRGEIPSKIVERLAYRRVR